MWFRLAENFEQYRSHGEVRLAIVAGAGASFGCMADQVIQLFTYDITRIRGLRNSRQAQSFVPRGFHSIQFSMGGHLSTSVFRSDECFQCRPGSYQDCKHRSTVERGNEKTLTRTFGVGCGSCFWKMSDDQGIGYGSEYWTNQTWYDEAHADRGNMSLSIGQRSMRCAMDAYAYTYLPSDQLGGIVGGCALRWPVEPASTVPRQNVSRLERF